jgi:S-adenosylmethionine-diacylglycerol 3-amino-3-carboxypropyl transferase
VTTLQRPTLGDRIDQKVFNAIYSRSLVYNTCWEDPAVDRQALQLGPEDTLLVITSAGCNALDYLLAGAGKVHAVDANPRQTALLELKLAGIRRLDFDDFFLLFGRGHHPDFAWLYRAALREHLSEFAQGYWDRNLGWFQSPRGSFYFHGLSGLVALAFRTWLRLRPGLAEPVDALLESRDLESQRQLYDEQIHPHLWGRGMNWVLSRQLTMSLLGVPYPQRREVQAQHPDGVAGFIRDCFEYVFRQLPVWDNYFWSLYLRGHYSPTCCPEYLKEVNFAALKGGLVERVEPHTCTVTEFLRRHDEPISRFVLLDHMDWMSSYHPQALVEEWEAILERATPGARILFRSAHARPAYLERMAVGGRSLRERLGFHDELAQRLTRQDRVHTYAGFHIAEVPA